MVTMFVHLYLKTEQKSLLCGTADIWSHVDGHVILTYKVTRDEYSLFQVYSS